MNKRWWLPRSLRGRFVLLMLGGVLLAQLISYGVWSAQVRNSHLDLVDRVSRNLAYSLVSTVQFFTSLPLEYRHLVLDQLRKMGGTRFFISINDHLILVDDIEDSHEKRLVVSNVYRILRQELNVKSVLVEFSKPENLRVLNNETLAMDLPPRWAQSLLLDPLSSPVMVVQMQLDSSAWLYVATVLPVPGFLQTGGWLAADKLAFLSIMLLVVIILSFIGIRWMTRPLAHIAKAAEDLGRDLEQAPLPESGPSEVVATAKAFNLMRERIQRYLEDRERLFSAISHDLKTPITRLRLRAELLDDDNLRERFGKDLAELDLMVKGALQCVKDTDIHENTETIQLADLLEPMLADYQLQGRQVRLSGQARAIMGKPLALKRCFTNLIDNALFYGERCEIQLEDDDSELRVRVLDNGPGIPEALLEQVFEPYVRLERSRSRHTGGSGLGLGIARHIVHAQGGRLTLSNRAEGGLEALVRLPRQTQNDDVPH
ncbi:ATP-binding protein [Balneatrix alpica]|uniref:ATP-binding protein n=1 Tax=Balneatrix alpica TaxID=75684 RepID=UPI00273A1A99|nr:ATP-binding protein [Balneatrix alpica]